MRLDELTPANDLLDDPGALQGRFREDGCLLVRRALPHAELSALIDQASGVLERWDVARRGQGGPRWTGKPLPVIDSVELDSVPAMIGLVRRFDTGTSLLNAVAERLCGHPMNLWRIAHLFTSIPDGGSVVQPHQDAYALTATGDYRRFWVALTCIPFGDGGLGLALGSHRLGRIPEIELTGFTPRAERHFPDSGKPVTGVDPGVVGDRWHTAALDPGDLLVFHSDMVHRGLPATSDRIRIALSVIASARTDPMPSPMYTLPENHARRS